MAEDHTDPALQNIASKLQLKQYVQAYFFNIALLFLRRHHNVAATTHNSNIETQTTSVSNSHDRVIEKATNDFLHEWGVHFWSSYVKKRQHLTILSPHGDHVKGRAARQRQYRLECEEWRQGRRAEKPEKLVNRKGLVYFGAGREEIERDVGAYFGRMVDMEVLGDAQAGSHGDLEPVGCRPSLLIPTKLDKALLGLAMKPKSTVVHWYESRNFTWA